MINTMRTRFIFIEYGDKDIYFNELKYSLMTLKSFHQLTEDDVYVYSESVERYKNLSVTPVSIKDEISSYSLSGAYHFRIKPLVMLRALRELPIGLNLLFLDTDTYTKQNLGSRISEINSRTVLMNKFETKDPYPLAVLSNFSLPSGLMYSYGPHSQMFNSGVVGISTEHEKILIDAVALIDGMRAAGFKSHTIEQCAVTEAFRIHGVQIHEVKKEVVHYWKSTDKKYMHNQLNRIDSIQSSDGKLPTFMIPHNWFLARLHKLLN